MTLKEQLEECSSIRKKMLKKDLKIYELKSKIQSPKNQLINDMPKGGNKQSNSLEDYLLKLEKLVAEKQALCNELNKVWESIEFILKSQCNCDRQRVKLMRLRYYNNYSWKKCISLMKVFYPNDKWNANKGFKEHRLIFERYEISDE